MAVLTCSRRFGYNQHMLHKQVKLATASEHRPNSTPDRQQSTLEPVAAGNSSKVNDKLNGRKELSRIIEYRPLPFSRNCYR